MTNEGGLGIGEWKNVIKKKCTSFFSVSVYDQSKGGEIGSWFSGCYKNAEDACYLKDTST